MMRFILCTYEDIVFPVMLVFTKQTV